MHETKFSDGSDITYYLATGYAEGFEDPPISDDIIKAWSYLCGTKIGYRLQGFFGRKITDLIDSGLLFEDGTVDWEIIETLKEINDFD